MKDSDFAHLRRAECIDDKLGIYHVAEKAEIRLGIPVPAEAIEDPSKGEGFVPDKNKEMYYVAGYEVINHQKIIRFGKRAEDIGDNVCAVYANMTRKPEHITEYKPLN